MKIGLLCNFYGFPENTEKVLEPWTKIKEVECIAASSFKYPEYAKAGWDIEDKETSKQLLDFDVDFLAYGKESNDSFSRNVPLQYLKAQGVDYVWLLDQDEFYKEEKIRGILEALDSNFAWYKVAMKNFVFDKDHYVKGFCPPRIFSTNYRNLTLSHFYYENDVCYSDKEGRIYDYKKLPCSSFLKEACDHYSWCGSDEFLKAKVKYQLDRYNGICSFKWDEEKGLTFNEEYYNMVGEEFPKVYER